VIFPEIASGFYTELLCGIDDVAVEHEFHLMTAFSHSGRDDRELVSRLLHEGRVDALILLHLSSSDSVVKGAARYGKPIVVIGRPVMSRNVFTVSIDNAVGAQAVAAHLLEHGHRKIAVITGPKDNFDAEQRLQEYKRAFAEAGSSISPEMVWSGAFTEASGREAIERWLASGRKLPSAILASNDSMAIGALGVLSERGYRVPEDVALVGFDDVESARHLSLTTVRVPMRQMGRLAAEAAIKPILSRRAQRQRVVATSLVVRRSCGCSLVRV
jgi:LacI family transcriptional regulator